MSSNAKMDVDNPLVLKRSSSAPMINDININTAPTSAPTPRENMSVIQSGAPPRPRRFSTSYSLLTSGPSSPKLTPRVNQLRREESVDVLGREAAHERELNSAMIMSQSWEDLLTLNLFTSNNKSSDNGGNVESNKLRSCGLSGGGLGQEMCGGGGSQCSSPVPSPTRTTVNIKQCFSPSVFKPTLSPSPTRKFATRRSQSPIAMRPSPLGPVKRKFELDEPEPSAKRGGLLIAQSKLEIDVGRNSLEAEAGCEPLASLPTDQPMPDISKSN